MRTDFYYDSSGEGKIHGCRWTPEGQVRAIVQIIHGIAEFVERYDEFACHLNAMGILVVAQDHMGHGKSMQTGTRGYFSGGWTAAVDDSYQLLRDTMAQFPNVPYILFGHSMGSFIARSILIRYPDSGIRAAVICGTAWMPDGIVGAGRAACALVCKAIGERTPSDRLQALIFGSYNKRVEHPRTPYDWLSRDEKIVDACIVHPNCGFTVSCGLLRDMLGGISMIQNKENLRKMNQELPTLFISGGDDPVGSYGNGVEQAVRQFRDVGMRCVFLKLFPLARHEILNEINRNEVYNFISAWICKWI